MWRQETRVHILSTLNPGLLSVHSPVLAPAGEPGHRWMSEGAGDRTHPPTEGTAAGGGGAPPPTGRSQETNHSPSRLSRFGPQYLFCLR